MGTFFFIVFGLAVLILGCAYAVARAALGHDPLNPPIPTPLVKETFKCWACGSGPWHRSWDPIEGGMTSYRRAKAGLGLCPNCSGAD